MILIEPVIEASFDPGGMWKSASTNLGPPPSTQNVLDLLPWAGESWASTMRLADQTAWFRSARSLHDPAAPNDKGVLLGLDFALRLALGGDSDPDEPLQGLWEVGIAVSHVPCAGHNVMLDNMPGPMSIVGPFATAVSPA